MLNVDKVSTMSSRETSFRSKSTRSKSAMEDRGVVFAGKVPDTSNVFLCQQEDEIRTAIINLSSKRGFLGICGDSGLGKSTIVATLLTDSKHSISYLKFPTYRLGIWLNCGEFGDETRFFNEIARLLGLAEFDDADQFFEYLDNYQEGVYLLVVDGIQSNVITERLKRQNSEKLATILIFNNQVLAEQFDDYDTNYQLIRINKFSDAEMHSMLHSNFKIENFQLSRLQSADIIELSRGIPLVMKLLCSYLACSISPDSAWKCLLKYGKSHSPYSLAIFLICSCFELESISTLYDFAVFLLFDSGYPMDVEKLALVWNVRKTVAESGLIEKFRTQGLIDVRFEIDDRQLARNRHIKMQPIKMFYCVGQFVHDHVANFLSQTSNGLGPVEMLIHSTSFRNNPNAKRFNILDRLVFDAELSRKVIQLANAEVLAELCKDILFEELPLECVCLSIDRLIDSHPELAADFVENHDATRLSRIACLLNCARLFRHCIDRQQPVSNADFYFEACRHGNFDILKCLLLAKSSVQSDDDINSTRDVDGWAPIHVAAQNGHVECVHLLVSNRADIAKAVKGFKRTALMIATLCGHRGVVLELLNSKDCSKIVNLTDNEGNSALLMAASKGYSSIVGDLVEHGAHVDQANHCNETALILASRKGYFKTVKVLIAADCDANLQGIDLKTALFHSVENQHVAVARVLLLSKRAVVDFRCSMGWTALMEAAEVGSVTLAALLLTNGANSNLRTDNTEETALHIATANSRLGVIKVLLARKANVNAKNFERKTALFTAVEQHCSVDIAASLIDYGADIESVDRFGNTALITAVRIGTQNPNSSEIIELLLNRNVNVMAKNNGGDTALLWAAKNADFSTLRELFNYSASVLVTNNRGEDALRCSVESGNLDLVVECLDHGAVALIDVIHRNETALMLASRRGWENIVRYLFRKGANIGLKNRLGLDALMIATSYGHLKIAKAILERASRNDGKDWASECKLFGAVASKDLASVRKLVESIENFDVSTSRNRRTSALIEAIRNDTPEIAEYLLEKRADVAFREADTRKSALHYATWMDQLAIVKLILNQFNSPTFLNWQDVRGKTALHYTSGSAEIAKLLCENGADVHLRSNDGSSVVLAVSGKSLDIVRYFVEEMRVDAEVANFEGETALMKAARLGDVSTVRYLLERGVEVDAVDSKGMTALLHAFNSNHEDVFEILLKIGASKSGIDRVAFSKISTTDLFEFWDIAGLIEDSKLVNLIRNGSIYSLNRRLLTDLSPNRQIFNGQSSLLIEAIKAKQDCLVFRLLELGGDPSLAIQRSPIVEAAEMGLVQLMDLLFKTPEHGKLALEAAVGTVRAEAALKIAELLHFSEIEKLKNNLNFLLAIDENNVEGVRNLLANLDGIDVKAAVKRVLANGNLSILDTLLQSSLIFSLVDSDDIFSAIGPHCYEMFEKLVSTNKVSVVNMKDSNGRTVLMEAARLGLTALVKLLLKNSANTSDIDESGLTAVELARRGNFIEIEELLERF